VEAGRDRRGDKAKVGVAHDGDVVEVFGMMAE
jgi:hypothetical protein